MRLFALVAAAGLLAAGVHAQTLTIADPLDVLGEGNSIVEVLTTDADGDPSTTTLRTILAETTTTSALTTTGTSTTATRTTATTTTTAAQGGGIVDQPASDTGTPHAPIEYQYTTTDADGDTVVLDATFTPTFPTTTPTTATGTGSVMAYSDYTAMFSVTSTAVAATAGAAAPSLVGGSGLFAVAGVVVVCVLGGLPVLMI